MVLGVKMRNDVGTRDLWEARRRVGLMFCQDLA
jgi:hypothetical protein